MLSKTEIFADIKEIIKKDYAGFETKSSVNRPEQYMITDDMSDQEFYDTIQSYLLDFQDGHLQFHAKNEAAPVNRGFKVRRYDQALWVTEANEEKALSIGDSIVEVDGFTITEYAGQYAKRLEDAVDERQSWNRVLRTAKQIKVERDGQLFPLTLGAYAEDEYTPAYMFEQLDAETVYLKLTDFAQAEPIAKLLRENEEALKAARNLIVDVRINYGGNDMFYFPLLDYVFDETIPFTGLFQPDEHMYTNYTERNCRLWISDMDDYLEQELDDYTKKSIADNQALFRGNCGKGMLAVLEEDDYIIRGQKTPQSVYVLSDVTCKSSGETFVQNAKKSPKVTVVGRPTSGIMDFFNVVDVDYGDFTFVYSISTMAANYHTNETGILPDVYLPWTPEHIKKDADLEYVRNLCKEKANA